MWTNGSICSICQCKHPQTSLSLRWLCICGFHYVITGSSQSAAIAPGECSVWNRRQKNRLTRGLNVFSIASFERKTKCPGSRQGRQPLIIIWPTIISPYIVPPCPSNNSFFLSNFPIIALSLPYTPVYPTISWESVPS